MVRAKQQPNKDCVFCQIARGDIPKTFRYQDKDLMAFDDINPHAPIHVLVVPKKHIESLAAITPKDKELMGQALYRCKELARKLNISDSGYRVTINVGKWGGQAVPHFHFHLLGGAPLTERLSSYTEAVALLSRK
jgi:histidine triad (HIT) family protein